MPLPVSPRHVTAEIEEQRWVELGLEQVNPLPQADATAAATVTLKKTPSHSRHGKALWTKLTEILQGTRLVASVPQPAAVSSEASDPPPPLLQYLALDLHFRQLSRLPGFLGNSEGDVTLLKGSTTNGSGAAAGDPPIMLSKGCWRCLYLDCSLNRFRSMDKRIGSLEHLLGLDLSSNLLMTTDGFVAPPSLQVLILSHNQLRDLRGLKGCHRLTYLDLSFNDLENLDLEDALHHMAHLHTLKLNRCNLARVDEMACLQSLQSLEMHGNQLSDIRPLAALASLETLDVCDNGIHNMPALAASLSLFKKLSSVDIKGNPVTQEPGYRYAIFDANRGVTSVDHTRASETVLQLIDDSKHQVTLHNSIQHITNEFQQRIEVEQQTMEHQMGGLRSREKELLDRFLAIKDALQHEMEESIAYVQRMDLLNAAAKREALTKDAPLQSVPQPTMRDDSSQAAPKVVEEEHTRGCDATERHPGIGSSSSSSMPEHAADAGSKASKEQSRPPDRLDAANIPTISGPTPSKPASHDDDKVEAPALPTSAPGSEGAHRRPSLPKEALSSPPDGLPQGAGSDTGGGSGSSKKSPTRWNLRSFFSFSPKAASKPGGPP